MNIYQKIQTAKFSLAAENLKKSGENKFAGFHYYELSDFLPSVIRIFNEIGLFSQIAFTSDLAILKIINTEKPDEIVEYTSPMKELELKGSNAMQALGGVETYQRRYLYMSALDITENDAFDAVSGKDDGKKETNKKPEPGNICYICEKCSAPFKEFDWNGKHYDAKTAYEWSKKKNGGALCKKCADSQGNLEPIKTGDSA